MTDEQDDPTPKEPVVVTTGGTFRDEDEFNDWADAREAAEKDEQ